MRATFYPGASRAAVIADITGPWTGESGLTRTTSLARKFVGNTVYDLRRTVAVDPISGSETTIDTRVFVHLLLKSGGDWGFKSYSEDEGSYYFDAPVTWLDENPRQLPSSLGAEWRNKVRARHAQRKALAGLPVGADVPASHSTIQRISVIGHKRGKVTAVVTEERGPAQYIGRTFAFDVDSIDWDALRGTTLFPGT